MSGDEVAELSTRIRNLAWSGLGESLDAEGCAVLPGLLTGEECAAMQALYSQAARFRKQVVMAKHGFGRGHYQYFAAPLPLEVATLREACYPPLSEVANRWQARLGDDKRYPSTLPAYLQQCAALGQALPTPLLLRYEAGDYNCLHQDLYGDEVFPLQVAVLLSRPGRDFSGGEFVMTEQRPRMQSRPIVLPFNQGDAIVFATRFRPVQGVRGTYRVAMRHGVSRLRSGERYTLGLIFHDALT